MDRGEANRRQEGIDRWSATAVLIGLGGVEAFEPHAVGVELRERQVVDLPRL
jgi:hypothetical protein